MQRRCSMQLFPSLSTAKRKTRKQRKKIFHCWWFYKGTVPKVLFKALRDTLQSVNYSFFWPSTWHWKKLCFSLMSLNNILVATKSSFFDLRWQKRRMSQWQKKITSGSICPTLVLFLSSPWLIQRLWKWKWEDIAQREESESQLATRQYTREREVNNFQHINI